MLRDQVQPIANRSRSDALRAGLISRFAISTANRSSASSTACASNWRTTAVNRAVLRSAGTLSIVCALLNCPYRASVDSRFTGTRDRFTRPSANAEISSTRSMARTIAVPVDFVGGVRCRSTSETRLPSGTTNSSASVGASWGSARCAARATASYRRRSAAARASDTCRASTDTPGSSTRFFRSHVTAWLKRATGPSACVHARPYRKPRNSRPHRPSVSPGTQTAPGSVPRARTPSTGAPHTTSHKASSMPSCPAPGIPRPPTAPQAGLAKESVDVTNHTDLHGHAKAVRTFMRAMRIMDKDAYWLVPHQATFALSTTARKRRSSAWPFRQMI